MDMTESDNNGSLKKKKDYSCVEKEHMFDKVMTPSDVGKLNRLVIPKQHAEKYFPLDSSTCTCTASDLLLNFEDPNGKSWRFRYSYWSSSQSYVITKGWSRFVKDKKLHAGDIVSFQRGVGGRLFIDSRRRPDPTSSARNFPHLPPLPPPPCPTALPSFVRPLPSLPLIINYGASSSFYGNNVYLKSAVDPNFPLPTAAKTLRLFGVDMMECADDQADSHHYNSSSYVDQRPEISSDRKGKAASMPSLELDL